jgi:Phytanoyl-CoA dioxygenase (PhyH)
MTVSETGSSRLNESQVKEYRKSGFVIYDETVFPAGEFDSLAEHFEEELLALAPGERPESMDCPHFTDIALFRWLLSDSVLDLVEPIIGPDIALFASHFICKPKGNGKRVPWHEDSFYWRQTLSPVDVVTVWLAIDPATAENGAMQVVPCALAGDSVHEPVDPERNVLSWEVKKRKINESEPVTIELAPNHASLHDCRLLHGSAANTSSLRRCGYTMRYMPTTVKLSDQVSHNIYLARGMDRAGNRYGDPTRRYEELARFRKRHGNGH